MISYRIPAWHGWPWGLTALHSEYEKRDGPREIVLYKREAESAPDIVRVALESYI